MFERQTKTSLIARKTGQAFHTGVDLTAVSTDQIAAPRSIPPGDSPRRPAWTRAQARVLYARWWLYTSSDTPDTQNGWPYRL